MAARRLGLSFMAAAWLVLPACSGDDGEGTEEVDLDGDTFTVSAGDCDDSNSQIHPGAPDPCDGIDTNCDGVPDEDFDMDQDGFSTCEGDCRDNDPTSNPSLVEIVDGLDNDCDGIPDNNTSQYDDDGDGYAEDQGDCNDNPAEGGALIGPEAIEVNLTDEGMPEEIDNDCDGFTDEGEEPCRTDFDPTTPMGFAAAMDICNEVQEAFFTLAEAEPRSRGIYSIYGNTYVPIAGETFAVLSSGNAPDANQPGFQAREGISGQFNITVPHPDPEEEPFSCNGNEFPDPTEVHDYTDLKLVLDVPANARSFSFDFNFMSVEFPEFVCTQYDDSFLAMLESQEFNGNVSFDSQGNRVTINIGFFDVCDDSLGSACTGEEPLLGTGYELLADPYFTEGGGTGWLTTTAPVRPGEKATLTFLIFDEGDWIYDSAVLLDNFRWHIDQVEGPVTTDRVLPDRRALNPNSPLLMQD